MPTATPERACLILVATLVGSIAASAQSIVPEPLPDPGIPGFRFPQREATLTGLITVMDRGTTPELREVARAQLYLHGWGLWTALTASTAQVHEGQRLRVYETWVTPDELTRETQRPPEEIVVVPERRRAALQTLHQLRERFDAAPVGFAPLGTQIDRVMGFTKYDPTAADHIVRQDLLRRATLDTLLAGGAQQIPPFPASALAVKPVFQLVKRRELADGRYYLLKAWSGPPAVPQAYAPAQWPDAVWVDLEGGGAGRGAIDASPAADGATRTDETTYPLDDFLHYWLSAADATALNAAKPGTDAAAGDCAVLVAMHVSGREIARWTWQTFWWTPSPDDPPAPSLAAIARARPAQLQGAARHYAMSLAYTLLSPDQPYIGGENAGAAVYAYNPWIEARFGPADLPDSRPGLDPAGLPAANQHGIQTNCMSCHAHATYDPRRLPTAPRFTGARYVDLGAAEFVGTLQVDFLWSLARHAK